MPLRRLGAALALFLCLLAPPAWAAQGSCAMPTTGPKTMATVMAALNTCLTAIFSSNSGSSAPANNPAAAISTYQIWVDTSTSPPSVKMYDGAQSVVIGTINSSTHAFVPAYTGHTIAILDAIQTFSAKQSFSAADMQGPLQLSTESAPAQITSDQNNYNPGAVVCATSATLLINSSAAKNITGLAGGVAGCLMAVINNGAFAITLQDENASSTAGNRFGFGGDLVLLAKQGALLKYDATGSRWRQIGGVPSSPGSGGTVAAGPGIAVSGTCTITASGTCTVATAISFAANSLGSDTALNNTANYFDGPSVAQGTSGTWLATGAVTLVDTAGAANFACKLWDATTLIASGEKTTSGANVATTMSLSGVLATPAANIRISCRDFNSTSGLILFNQSGLSKDSTLTAVRLQ